MVERSGPRYVDRLDAQTQQPVRPHPVLSVTPRSVLTGQLESMIGTCPVSAFIKALQDEFAPRSRELHGWAVRGYGTSTPQKLGTVGSECAIEGATTFHVDSDRFQIVSDNLQQPTVRTDFTCGANSFPLKSPSAFQTCSECFPRS